jgi:hypothetical protein
MVATAPPIEDTLQPLLNFIGTSVLVAHNARFDLGFINAALLMHDYEPLPNRVLDTVGLSRRIVVAEVKKNKIEYPVLVDPKEENWKRWQQSMWPTVYLIDKQQRVRYYWNGELEWQGAGGYKKLTRFIEELLIEKGPPAKPKP